ncbi:MAG: UDP-N-acetylmuramoylalanine/D-glutamate ligase, partial [Frankiales bacterium]|nr:UDP-N-acetylmuramoylalanine/D-glutamate ligase [Frankiales bacterium]
NLAPDHLDRHGTMAEYSRQKSKVWAGAQLIANADDPLVVALLESWQAETGAGETGANESGAGESRAGQRVTTFTLGPPAAGQYGVRDQDLVDGDGRSLIDAAEVRPSGRHNLANALAAAALAATVGAPPSAVADGLRQFTPDPHRNQFVATVDGVDYIDDSKATNPHAAAASLAAYPAVVWIAGGQLKDAPIDGLVAEFADRLRGAVLLGADRAVIAAALARHAPDVPVIVVTRSDDGAMQDVVRAAASLAAAGDAVLLAPAAASLDLFSSYGARGAAFAQAVAGLAATPSGEARA